MNIIFFFCISAFAIFLWVFIDVLEHSDYLSGICMVSFQPIPPKRAGPEALLTGDGLIREQGRGGNVMIIHFSSLYLELYWDLPQSFTSVNFTFTCSRCLHLAVSALFSFEIYRILLWYLGILC